MEGLDSGGFSLKSPDRPSALVTRTLMFPMPYQRTQFNIFINYNEIIIDCVVVCFVYVYFIFLVGYLPFVRLLTLRRLRSSTVGTGGRVCRIEDGYWKIPVTK